ncbi:MAG: hypothetical protein COA52_09900 [Hyphomicrobiales bacterium]|nr:MAG: hypothetical protein COA52_09900 [Hyphomicrobiales bacterium]
MKQTISIKQTLLAAALAPAVMLGSFGVSAFAAGSDSSEPPKPTQTTKDCKNGKIWDKKHKKCMTVKSEMFDDDTLYTAARELAYDGQYDNAINILELAANRDDPRILNYLGFANRKAGRMEVGMGYYKEALKKNPDYILARSYMGQAYLQQKNWSAARQQLTEIDARGGKDTWAYASLSNSLLNSRTY